MKTIQWSTTPPNSARYWRTVCRPASPTTCLAEVFQQKRTINRWHNEPWLVGFAIAKPLRLLDLSGAFTTRAGASLGLMTGPRSIARNWARGFHESYADIDGLQYPCTMHGNAPVMVLNERAEARAVLLSQPSFHRALSDPAVLTLMKNAARELGLALN